MNETEIERLVVRLVGDPSSYQKMLRDAERLTLTATQRMKAAGAKLEASGRRMITSITLPLTAFGGAAVYAFARFDQAMTESLSIMEVTEAQAIRMRDAALSLAGQTPQGPTELGRSYFYLASAGKDAEQSMALLPKVAKFATAGAFDMARATDLLTDAQSALGLSTKDVAEDTRNLTRVSDVLVKANTLANASVEQFGIALTSKAGASLKAFNKDVEEGVAVLAAMADQGIKAELAGNQLDRLIRLLAKSASDNAAAHKRLGFEVFDVTGRMKNLGGIVRNLEDILHGMSDETKVATLEMLGFEARIQQVILPLLGTSDAIKKYEEELRKAGGTTESVANKQLASFSNQMKMLKNDIMGVVIALGEHLSPALLDAGKAAKATSGIFSGMNPHVKDAAITFGILTALLGPMKLIFGKFLSLLATVSPHAIIATAAIVAFTTAIRAMRDAVRESNEETKESAQNLKNLETETLKRLSTLPTAVEEEIAALPPGQRVARTKQEFQKQTEHMEAELRRRIAVLKGAYADFERERRLLESPDPATSISEKWSMSRLFRQQAAVFGIDQLAAYREAVSQAEASMEEGAKKLQQQLREQRDIIGQLQKEQLVAAAKPYVAKAWDWYITTVTGLYMKGNQAMIGSVRALGTSLKDTADLEKRAKEITRQHRTAQERYNDTVAELKELRPFFEDPQTYDRAMRSAKEMLEETKEQLKDLDTEVNISFKVERINAAAWGSAEHKARYLEYQAGTPAGRMAAGRGKEAEAIDRTNMAKDIHDLTETAREFWGDDKSGMFTLKWSELN